MLDTSTSPGPARALTRAPPDLDEIRRKGWHHAAAEQQEAINDRKVKAAKGWIGTPPPPQDYTPPSHQHKWRKMMGAERQIPSEPAERDHEE